MRLLACFLTMTYTIFVFCFFCLLIAIGALIAHFIVIDDPDIKEFQPNMGLNLTIFVLIVIGIVYVLWSDTRNLFDDWVTLGGFLAVTTTNVSLGVVLNWRKSKLSR